MSEDERKDVTIGAPPADAGDGPQPDPLGPDTPPDQEDDGEDKGE